MNPSESPDAATQTEAHAARDAALDPGEIAFDAARNFIRRGFPDVSTDCDCGADEHSDECRHAAMGDVDCYTDKCRDATMDAAETALVAVGFDPDNPDVQAVVVEESTYAAFASLYRSPRPPSVIVGRPVGHLQNRSRASHGKSIRRRGSRRGADCSTRASPDDGSGDSDPDGEHHPLDRQGYSGTYANAALPPFRKGGG